MRNKLTLLLFIVAFAVKAQVTTPNSTLPVQNTQEVFTHNIGDLFQGGIIVSVWKDNEGVEHGIIASLTDLSPAEVWSNVDHTHIGIHAQSRTDGYNNTTAIINQNGHSESAAKVCKEYIYQEFNDWYLPSIWELNECFKASTIVNEKLGFENGFQPEQYWSSTEDYYGNFAWYENFKDGSRNYKVYYFKDDKFRVRAVRKF